MIVVIVVVVVVVVVVVNLVKLISADLMFKLYHQLLFQSIKFMDVT